MNKMGSLSPPEPPSMEAQVHDPLNHLESSLNQLITSLTTSPTYSAALSTTQSLLTADDSLTSALQTLHTHQKNYARILQLRADASRLEDSIKSTIRTCVDLRSEIGSIHPSILSRSEDDSDDSGVEIEEGRDAGKGDVDYHTLLSFASKIGKHNTAAAKEAEQESVRRLTKARKEGAKTTTTANAEEPKTNGNTPAQPTASSPNAATNGGPASQDLIPPGERDWLDAEAAMARARSGMAFPAAENLRKGMLGRLQWVREQQGGEDAVEREVERMIAEAEGRPVTRQEGAVEPAGENAPPVTNPIERRRQGQGQGQGPTLPSRPSQAARPAEKKKSVVALDLDLWNEDDDDDED
jgi:Vitamin-D-receptor interacting Mediator subunit 4